MAHSIIHTSAMHRLHHRWLCLCAAAAVSTAPAAAQPFAPPVSRVIARHWGDVPADTAALRELQQASWETGGETIHRGVLSAAADPARPYEVRLHALAALAEFMVAGSGPRSLPIFRDAGERRIADCRPSTAWSPGDTIRSCVVPQIVWARSTHWSYRASTSIRPLLRDTVRAVVRALATADPDPRLRSAARVMWGAVGLTERWNASRAEACRALTAGAEGGGLRPASYFDYATCEETGPELLARAWRSAPADSTERIALMRASQGLRDRRLQHGLQEVAADTTRDVTLRRAALITLAALADGRMRSTDIPAGEPERCTAGWGAEQEEGGEPMGRAGRDDVFAFLVRLAGDREGRDPVQREAARLAGCLNDLSAHPAHRP